MRLHRCKVTKKSNSQPKINRFIWRVWQIAVSLRGVLQISFYVHLWVPTYAWSLIAPNLHISLFQSVTMPASLLHAKKKSAALSFNNRLGANL